jgi:methionyl aminopeptidase
MASGATIAPAPRAATTRLAPMGMSGSGRLASMRTASGAGVRVAGIELRSRTDIAGIARAGAVVAEALAAARIACVPGATTASIDEVVRSVISSHGAEALFLGYASESARREGRRPFPAATCISVNEELVHGVPGARIVAEGDIVSIDAGVRLDGWCADAAITVAVGAVRPEARALVACAEEMLATAVARMRPGVLWSTIAAELEEVAVAAGHAIAVDFVGHGIGRELHEAPQVPCSVYRRFLEAGDFTLRPGMVLAIEPMLVLEQPLRNQVGELVGPKGTLSSDGWTVTVDSGAWSCHVEHTVAVTRDGAVILTATPSPEGAVSNTNTIGRSARAVAV